MKKKYLAVVLGMALSLTSVCVFADEETDALEDVVIVEESDEAEEYTGRINSVNEDGSVVISIGEMMEDDADETLGTLTLTGEELEAAFSEEVSAAGLVEYKTITVVEAAEDESTDEESSDETSDADVEITDSDTTEEDVSEEDADSDTAEEDSSSEDTDTEDTENTEEEVETEEILTSDLEAGDIITFTVDENGDINTVTLIGVDADILEEAVTSDAEEDVAEETSSDTEA